AQNPRTAFRTGPESVATSCQQNGNVATAPVVASRFRNVVCENQARCQLKKPGYALDCPLKGLGCPGSRRPRDYSRLRPECVRCLSGTVVGGNRNGHYLPQGQFMN